MNGFVAVCFSANKAAVSVLLSHLSTIISSTYLAL